MKGSSTSGNLPAPSEGNTDDCSESTGEVCTTTESQYAADVGTTEEPIVLIEPPVHTEAEAIQQPQPRPSKKKRIEPPTNQTDEAFIEWLAMKKRREKKKTEEEEECDADWLFFKSMLPDFKKLDSRRKRELKATFLLRLNEQLDERERDNEQQMSQWTSSDDCTSFTASTFLPSPVTPLPPDPNPAVYAELR